MATELTKDQQDFLNECQREFADRFTEKDKDFMTHCERPVNPPPILDEFRSRGHYSNRDRDRQSGGNDGRHDYNRRNHNHHHYQHRQYNSNSSYGNYNSSRYRDNSRY